jgi:hypothetical protein
MRKAQGGVDAVDGKPVMAAAAAALGPVGERLLPAEVGRRNVLEAGASRIGNFVCRVVTG